MKSEPCFDSIIKMLIRLYILTLILSVTLGLKCKLCTGQGALCSSDTIMAINCDGSCVKQYLYQNSVELIKRYCSYDKYPDGCQNDYGRKVVSSCLLTFHQTNEVYLIQHDKKTCYCNSDLCNGSKGLTVSNRWFWISLAISLLL